MPVSRAHACSSSSFRDNSSVMIINCACIRTWTTSLRGGGGHAGMNMDTRAHLQLLEHVCPPPPHTHTTKRGGDAWAGRAPAWRRTAARPRCLHEAEADERELESAAAVEQDASAPATRARRMPRDYHCLMYKRQQLRRSRHHSLIEDGEIGLEPVRLRHRQDSCAARTAPTPPLPHPPPVVCAPAVLSRSRARMFVSSRRLSS